MGALAETRAQADRPNMARTITGRLRTTVFFTDVLSIVTLTNYWILNHDGVAEDAMIDHLAHRVLEGVIDLSVAFKHAHEAAKGVLLADPEAVFKIKGDTAPTYIYRRRALW